MVERATLADSVTRGIDRGLRDMGGDVTGCTPSMLSGWVIRQMREDGNAPDPMPRPDLSRLAEMTGYLRQLADETGDRLPLDFWIEIQRSINAPIKAWLTDRTATEETP